MKMGNWGSLFLSMRRLKAREARRMKKLSKAHRGRLISNTRCGVYIA